MNLKRGFLRLWLVGVVLWVGVCGWMQFPDWQANWDGTVQRQAEERSETQLRLERDCGDTASPNWLMTRQCELAVTRAEMEAYSPHFQPPWEMAAVMFGSPLGILVAGEIIAWIARGFRRKGSPS